MSLYFMLLTGSIAVPLLLSFDKKLQFYKQWKYLMPSIAIIACCYIAVDVYFTQIGVWGFNNRYHSSISVWGLPIEEWLFFIIIPYASIFLHDSIVLYFSQLRISISWSRYVTVCLILTSLLLVVFNTDKAYTAYIFSLMTLALTLSFTDKTNVIRSFYVTFLVILIPFLIVNSILTGSFIEQPIVWYNNDENLAIRFFTIPIEDFGYGFSLIFFILLLRNKLKSIFEAK